MSGFVARRLDADARAGLRLSLAAFGLLLVTVLVLPLAVLVRDEWRPLADLDARVEQAAYDATVGSQPLYAAARLLTHLGAPVLLEAAAAVLVLVLVARRRPRSAGYLAACVLGAYTLSTLGKQTIDRARPVFDEPLSAARGASFPSGHATGSAAFYLALAVVLIPLVPIVWRRLLFAVALVVPLVVAATRVLLGVHYLTDVTAGVLLGWGWVVVCTALFALWRADEGRRGSVLDEGVEP